jgi:hypothetical protein
LARQTASGGWNINKVMGGWKDVVTDAGGQMADVEN